MAVRQDIGFNDMSTFTKILITINNSNDLETLQYLCANVLPTTTDRAVYSHFLNERGGVEIDCTLRKISDKEYLLIGGGKPSYYIQD